MYSGLNRKKSIFRLRSVKLWDVMVNATRVRPGEVQRNVFFWLEGDPCQQPRQLNASDMQKCEFLTGYDSFQVRCP